MSNAGQAILQVAGFAASAATGNPYFYMGASLLGSTLFPTKLPDVHGPRLTDFRGQTANYGEPIPKVYGAARVAGNLIWSSGIKETVHENSAGGKGGGPEQSYYTYTYSCSFAVGICEGPQGRINKIWADGKLIYSVADIDSYFKSLRVPVVFYPGSETQTADPTMEAIEGAGNVPTYRGLAYAVFTDFQLADYGNRIPNLEFEIVTALTSKTIDFLYSFPMPTTGYPYYPTRSIMIDDTYFVYQQNNRLDSDKMFAGKREGTTFFTTDSSKVGFSHDQYYSGSALGIIKKGTYIRGLGNLQYDLLAAGEEYPASYKGGGYITWFYHERGKLTRLTTHANGLGVRPTGSWCTLPSELESTYANHAYIKTNSYIHCANGYIVMVEHNASSQVLLSTWDYGNWTDFTDIIGYEDDGVTPIYHKGTGPRLKDRVVIGEWPGIQYCIDSTPAHSDLIYGAGSAEYGNTYFSIWQVDDVGNITQIAHTFDPDGTAAFGHFTSITPDGRYIALLSLIRNEAGIKIFEYDHATRTVSKAHAAEYLTNGGGNNSYSRCDLQWLDNEHLLVGRQGSNPVLLKWIPSAESLEIEIPDASPNVNTNCGTSAYNSLLLASGQPDKIPTHISFWFWNASAQSISLSDVVKDICNKSNLTDTDIDVTDLTETIDGYVAPGKTTGKKALEPLMIAYQFDAAEIDNKLTFIKRNSINKTTQNNIPPLTWENLSGVDITDRLITKISSSTEWDGAANSVDSRQNDYIFTCEYTSSSWIILGTTNDPTGVGYANIDRAFFINSHTVYVREFNTHPVGGISGTVGDIFKITRTNGTVKYFKNDSLLYTSPTPSVGKVQVDVCIKTVGGTVKVWGFSYTDILEDDLAAHDESVVNESVFPTVIKQQTEMPIEVDIKYSNKDRDYLIDQQKVGRIKF